jgi:hypothetical protein
MAFNRLARAYLAPFDPPRTVADVAGLYQRRLLGEIWGLGPRRISEIEAGLVFAGVVIAHSHPASSRPAT